MACHDYTYANGGDHQTGVMVCFGCRQPIGAEPYRYYETDKGFVNHHRRCCSNDPGWQRVDAEDASRREQHTAYLIDCRAFFDKWGVSNFTDDLADAGVE